MIHYNQEFQKMKKKLFFHIQQKVFFFHIKKNYLKRYFSKRGVYGEPAK